MKRTLLISLALLCAVFSNAQRLIYHTDTIKGKVFYRYPVQKGEGLYRISKNFSVSQEDIVKYNPELQNSGLKLGQTILIPVVMPVDSAQYIVHELQPKETLYGISRLYGVKIAKIEELNPHTSKSMRIGEKLLIPKTDKSVSVAQKLAAETKTGDAQTDSGNTGNDVNKDNTPAEEVKTEVVETKPADTTTDTPAHKQTSEQIQHLVQQSFSSETDSTPSEQTDTLSDALTADTLLTSADTLSADSVSLPQPLKIAVLLPLMTDAPKRDAAVERFTEFYEGLLMAVNRVQSEGERFIIRTYDTDKTEARILTILADSALQDVDLIIGPAYPAQTTIVSEFSKQHQIPVIVPFTSKISDIDSNPYLLQFNPSEQVEAQAVAARIRQYADDIHCIAFNDPSQPLSDKAQALRNEFKEQDLSLSAAPVSLLIADSASYLFNADKLNIVLLPSDKYSAVQSALRHLESLQNKYRICVVAEYAWQKEKLNIKQTYTNLFDASRQLSGENLYYKMTRKIYFPYDPKNDSPRYDLLGYDIMRWAVLMLQQPSGSLSEKVLSAGEYEGLQSSLRFEKVSEEGGWMNYGLKVVGM